MAELLLLLTVLIACFVGFNIGGSTTGPAFGPAVGAMIISKVAAAVLMSVFFFLGAWTLGPNVVRTLGNDIVGGAAVFTLETAPIVLILTGSALFLGNYTGVPASTSMTAVGAIAALGLSTGNLDRTILGEIATWWVVAPILGFWISGVIGRYFYSEINRRISIERTAEPLFKFEIWTPSSQTAISWISLPVIRPRATVASRKFVGGGIVVGVGCLMAIASGASNVANAIAPVYGTGNLTMSPLIVVGCLAVAAGSVTIARRTLETLGNEITDLPLAAAIVVAIVSSTLTAGLAALGIPASFVIIATMSTVGLGWGRATRTASVPEGSNSDEKAFASSGPLTAAESGRQAPAIGEESYNDSPEAAELFDPTTTGRVLLLQNVIPILSAVGAYVVFQALFAVTG